MSSLIPIENDRGETYGCEIQPLKMERPSPELLRFQEQIFRDLVHGRRGIVTGIKDVVDAAELALCTKSIVVREKERP